MASKELGYSEFRAQVEKFNADSESYSFCKSIRGGCCTSNIQILKEDGEHIRDVIQTGQISRDTVKRAQRRARDNEVTRCPFLGESDDCTIYPFRPIVCINHGNGGIPLDKDMVKPILTGSTEDVVMKDLGPFSCANCVQLIDNETSVPVEIVRKSMIIGSNAEKGQTTRMRSFLTESLPHY